MHEDPDIGLFVFARDRIPPGEPEHPAVIEGKRASKVGIQGGGAELAGPQDVDELVGLLHAGRRPVFQVDPVLDCLDVGSCLHGPVTRLLLPEKLLHETGPLLFPVVREKDRELPSPCAEKGEIVPLQLLPFPLPRKPEGPPDRKGKKGILGLSPGKRALPPHPG